jgi:hypothetical protein
VIVHGYQPADWHLHWQQCSRSAVTHISWHNCTCELSTNVCWNLQTLQRNTVLTWAKDDFIFHKLAAPGLEFFSNTRTLELRTCWAAAAS